MPQTIKNLLESLRLFHPKEIDLSLHRINHLLAELGNPHRRLPRTIHVAGTNGKGSTIAFMKAALEAANYKVHAYISPHLVDFNERIILQSSPISHEFLEHYLTTVQTVLTQKKLQATFFEIITAAAFLAFSQIPADFLLLETGLGGRLDATNVVENPLICLITSISYDHENFLGSTLEKISREKLGIIKPSATVIIAPQCPSVASYCSTFITSHSKKLQHNNDWFLTQTDQGFSVSFLDKNLEFSQPNLLGKHQHENAAAAVMALSVLNIPFLAIKKGLEKATWPGRLQKIYYSCDDYFYIDGAHNPSGMEVLSQFIKQTPSSKGPIIIGTSILNNRSIANLLKPLESLTDNFFYIDCDDSQFHPYSAFPAYVKETVSLNSLKNFLAKQQKPSRIFLTGSLYLVGNILTLDCWEKKI